MPSVPLELLCLHFLGDAVLQDDWMALGKSKGLLPLTVHAATYAACFLLISPGFAAVTFVAHWLTDWCTSRISAKLWFVVPAYNEHGQANGLFTYASGSKRHWFFVSLLFDQLLHFAQLAYTYEYLA